MIRNFAFVMLLMAVLPSFSCMNGHHVRNSSGDWIEIEEDFSPIRVIFNTSDHKAQIEEFRILYENNKDDKYLIDIGILEAELGNYKEALNIFQELNERKPNDYRITANLGTCYELNGEIDSAYKYIKKGMEINPSSHYGSEYIHLKVLEVKKKMKADPDYLKTHDVLNFPKRLKVHQAEEKASQLLHQLRERMPYSPVPDPVVANLLKTLGDLYYVYLSLEDSYYAYNMSKQYTVGSKKIINLRIKKSVTKLKGFKMKKPKKLRAFIEDIKAKKDIVKTTKPKLIAKKVRVEREVPVQVLSKNEEVIDTLPQEAVIAPVIKKTIRLTKKPLVKKKGPHKGILLVIGSVLGVILFKVLSGFVYKGVRL